MKWYFTLSAISLLCGVTMGMDSGNSSNSSQYTDQNPSYCIPPLLVERCYTIRLYKDSRTFACGMYGLGYKKSKKEPKKKNNINLDKVYFIVYTALQKDDWYRDPFYCMWSMNMHNKALQYNKLLKNADINCITSIMKPIQDSVTEVSSSAYSANSSNTSQDSNLSTVINVLTSSDNQVHTTMEMPRSTMRYFMIQDENNVINNKLLHEFIEFSQKNNVGTQSTTDIEWRNIAANFIQKGIDEKMRFVDYISKKYTKSDHNKMMDALVVILQKSNQDVHNQLTHYILDEHDEMICNALLEKFISFLKSGGTSLQFGPINRYEYPSSCRSGSYTHQIVHREADITIPVLEELYKTWPEHYTKPELEAIVMDRKVVAEVERLSGVYTLPYVSNYGNSSNESSQSTDQSRRYKLQ